MRVSVPETTAESPAEMASSFTAEVRAVAQFPEGSTTARGLVVVTDAKPLVAVVLAE